MTQGEHFRLTIHQKNALLEYLRFCEVVQESPRLEIYEPINKCSDIDTLLKVMESFKEKADAFKKNN